MTRFAPLLQRASARIDLPQPIKSRILLEMAGDLEDLYQHHLARGLDEGEAARRAEEAFAINDDNLRYLIMIHKSARDNIGDGVSRQIGTWWEKLLLVLLVVFVLLLASGAATRNNLVTSADPFVWPVLGLAAIALGIALAKLVRLFRGRDLDVRKFRRGIGTILFLAVAMLATGVFGFFVEFCLLMNRLGNAEVLADMRRSSAIWTEKILVMMNVTMLTSILIALVWFLLVGVAARLERNRAQALLEV